ncbi:MAG: lytic transglycosylase, partial [Hyphomicrobiales bacterium]|nr:lytic transglycosylase [Hyphomicrobiales bacterium]
TARQMGYRGAPAGLLDADTNLTYAMPYLANAWIVSGGNETRAASLYSRGYYYEAKRKGLLRTLHTARVMPLDTAEQAR